jgi:hypothetical protein
LGKEELAYRQVVRDIERLVGCNGFIRRKQTHVFERYLSHPNARVRAFAEEVAAEDARMREESRRMRLAEEEAESEREGLHSGAPGDLPIEMPARPDAEDLELPW